jgi:predicted MFS family arabinose efflux permease
VGYCRIVLSGWKARMGVRLVATISVMGYALALWALGHASHLFSLCGLAFLFGAAKRSVDVSINTQAVTLDRPGHRFQMSFFQGCWSVGGLAGSGVSALLLRHGRSVSKDMSATAVLLVALAAAALPFLPLDGVAVPGRSRPAWPSPYLLLLGTLAFFGLLVEGVIADWTSVFLHSNLQLSLAVDWLAEQISGKWLLIVSGLLIAVGVGSLLLCNSWYVAAPGLMFAGFGTANVVPVLWSAAGRDPVIGPGPAISIVSTIGYLGFLAGPPMIGGGRVLHRSESRNGNHCYCGIDGCDSVGKISSWGTELRGCALKPKTLIVEMDGVLVDSEPLHERAK